MKRAEEKKKFTAPAGTARERASEDIQAIYAHVSSRRIEAKVILLGHEAKQLAEEREALETDLKSVKMRQEEAAGEIAGLSATLAVRAATNAGAVCLV